MAVLGDYAYATDPGGCGEWNARLDILDVSDPTDPQWVGPVEQPHTLFTRTTIADGLLYVAEGGYHPGETSGLRIFDLSTPTSLRQVGYFAVPMASNAVVVEGNLAFVVNAPFKWANVGGGREIWNDVRIVDVSSPDRPRQIGVYADNKIVCAMVTVLQGDYAYVHSQDSGLNIVDMSDPMQPQSLGVYPPPDRPNTEAITTSPFRATMPTPQVITGCRS